MAGCEPCPRVSACRTGQRRTSASSRLYRWRWARAFIILTLIVAVAAFNLVSTLVMVVTDKEADIAILRTLGARVV